MKVGFIGWRGMVGSVLINRMKEEQDFKFINPIFFTTSNIGGNCPIINNSEIKLQDAKNIDNLKKCDIIITCQGSEYTKKIFPELCAIKWNGYWIDSSSALRMQDYSVIALDPININIIKNSIIEGKKVFVSGNCTVNLMLMALGGLFKENLIEWLTSMTYQAASGGGAKYMIELLQQMGILYMESKDKLNDSMSQILDIDKNISKIMKSSDMPINYFNSPLAGSLIPWIGEDLNNGISTEEYKVNSETNKILWNLNKSQYSNFKIDSLCIRIAAMRCHSQAFTIKLKKNISINNIENIIKSSNNWVKIIPNNKKISINELSPSAVSGTLNIPIGRIRKLTIGDKYISAFTVGDQLLWGAAEPLRRVMHIILNNK